MSNHATPQGGHDDLERNAYNAAFYELGLRWHWDSDTYRGLLNCSAIARERIRMYLEQAQPHLLKAYDADFLVDAIETRQAHYKRSGFGGGSATALYCNWGAIQAGEVGA